MVACTRDSDGYTNRGARAVESSLKWREKIDAICGVFFLYQMEERGCGKWVRQDTQRKRCKKKQ